MRRALGHEESPDEHHEHRPEGGLETVRHRTRHDAWAVPASRARPARMNGNGHASLSRREAWCAPLMSNAPSDLAEGYSRGGTQPSFMEAPATKSERTPCMPAGAFVTERAKPASQGGTGVNPETGRRKVARAVVGIGRIASGIIAVGQLALLLPVGSAPSAPRSSGPRARVARGPAAEGEPK